MIILGGLDIGGTKCAVTAGSLINGKVELLGKRSFPTPDSSELALQKMTAELADLSLEKNLEGFDAIGISCGGPLDSRAGLILSPPNLPGWDELDCITPVKEKFSVPVGLQNDANACALAEWKWGAGKGTKNMIFLTFGTGMGAGFILDGRLYSGTNDMAGEVGHMRLAEDGPVGYGKAGSFEGFCSGGGIAKLAKQMVKEAIEANNPPVFCKTLDEVDALTAHSVGVAAQNGDEFALGIYRCVGEKLGLGVSLLVDILNPQCVVIGSIYGRQINILEETVKEKLEREALSQNLKVCKILPAGLGENIGDFASLSVALDTFEKANM